MLPEEPPHGRAADGRPARRRHDRRKLVHPPLQRGRQDPHRPRQPLARAVVARRPGTRPVHRERAARQARIELLPGLVGELDEAENLRGYCRNCFTFSIPALTHSSSTPGEPDRPMPPIVSLPTLIGTPPLIAITPGSVVCSRRTGRVFISCRKASVVILNVRAV